LTRVKRTQMKSILHIGNKDNGDQSLEFTSLGFRKKIKYNV